MQRNANKHSITLSLEEMTGYLHKSGLISENEEIREVALVKPRQLRFHLQMKGGKR